MEEAVAPRENKGFRKVNSSGAEAFRFIPPHGRPRRATGGRRHAGASQDLEVPIIKCRCQALMKRCTLLSPLLGN